MTKQTKSNYAGELKGETERLDREIRQLNQLIGRYHLQRVMNKTMRSVRGSAPDSSTHFPEKYQRIIQNVNRHPGDAASMHEESAGFSIHRY